MGGVAAKYMKFQALDATGLNVSYMCDDSGCANCSPVNNAHQTYGVCLANGVTGGPDMIYSLVDTTTTTTIATPQQASEQDSATQPWCSAGAMSLCLAFAVGFMVLK